MEMDAKKPSCSEDANTWESSCKCVLDTLRLKHGERDWRFDMEIDSDTLTTDFLFYDMVGKAKETLRLPMSVVIKALEDEPAPFRIVQILGQVVEHWFNNQLATKTSHIQEGLVVVAENDPIRKEYALQ